MKKRAKSGATRVVLEKSSDRHAVRLAWDLGDHFVDHSVGSQNRANAGHSFAADCDGFDCRSIVHNFEHRENGRRGKIDVGELFVRVVHRFVERQGNQAQVVLDRGKLGWRQMVKNNICRSRRRVRHKQPFHKEAVGRTLLPAVTWGNRRLRSLLSIPGLRPKRGWLPR